LFGEHSVVYGYKALAVSLKNLRTSIKASLIQEERLIMFTSKFNIDISIKELKKKINFGDNLEIDKPEFNLEVFNAIKEEIKNETKDEYLAINATLYIFLNLARFSKKNVKGIKIEMTTNIPIGAGLGSSGSFSSVLASALFILFDLFDEDIKFKESLVKFEETDFKYCNSEQALGLINKWAFLVEKNISWITFGHR